MTFFHSQLNEQLCKSTGSTQARLHNQSNVAKSDLFRAFHMQRFTRSRVDHINEAPHDESDDLSCSCCIRHVQLLFHCLLHVDRLVVEP